MNALNPEKPRGAGRISLNAEVAIRRSGMHPFRVRAFDASPVGCKIEFIERPGVGERVWIKFDGLQALEARVCWIEGHTGGVRFTRQLHEAVFAQLVAASQK